MPIRNQLHARFEDRAREDPKATAVRCGDQQITYGKLNERADRLAVRLKTQGVMRDVLVGLCVERGIELIIGMLGILKAGGAYVPVDPAYPKKRIEFLLNDSLAGIVVTGPGAPECLNECAATLVAVDDALARQPNGAWSTQTGDCQASAQALPGYYLRELTDADPPVLPGEDSEGGENLAYVIYTSGSTGTPKGVQVEHRNVVRLFEQTQHWFTFDKSDIWTMFHSISFDFSVWEIWGALLYGGTLVIVPSVVARSPEELQRLVVAEMVTVLCQTPTAFQHFVAADNRNWAAAPYSLRLVIFGGESLNVRMLQPWAERYGLDRPELINMYGITETTVHVTYKRLSERDLARQDLSVIGVPLPDLQVHLLDEQGEPVPDGLPGEMHISGRGVARGYLNRPELTAERFVINSESVRMYCSGDRAARLSNGELIYLGRTDDQVKVRGFRIEPREIELCLAAHPAISSANVVVLDYGEGDVRLIAFAVAYPGIALTPDVTRRISSDLATRSVLELPAHMRPSAYFVLPELPRTEHGKLDRAELRSICASREADCAAVPKSLTQTQEALTRVWEDILGCAGIRPQDDFFDLGGTSLSLIRMLVRVNDCYGIKLNGSDLGECANIQNMATCVEAALAKLQMFQMVDAN